MAHSIAAFSFMAVFFYRTLRPGAVPLITLVARMEHPDLPPDMDRYSRRLTWAWTLCFTLLLAVALGLLSLTGHNLDRDFDEFLRWIRLDPEQAFFAALSVFCDQSFSGDHLLTAVSHRYAPPMSVWI